MTVSTTTTLQATFVSESAAYENTFGWYNKVTGYGGILFADTEAEGRNAPLVPGVSSVNFTVNTADLGNIQFFLISDGYNRNSGDDFTGAIKVIQLSDGSWAVANVDSEGRVITRHGKPDILVGEGANALFTETSKNAGGVDYASSVTGTNQTAAKLAGDTADGATGLIAWEDIAATRKSNGSYTKPGDADYNDAVFRITTVDGNRPPVGNADSVSVGEDAGPSTINVLGNDTDPDAGDTLRVTAVNTAGLVGTVTIGAGGANIAYTPAASFQSLGAGQTATETFSYTVSDAAGATSTASVTVTIVGANDVAVIGNPINASVTEDLGANGAGNLTATGTISVTDVDTGQAGFQTAVTGAGSNLGSLVIAANGAYTYTVANAATQSLAVGETRTDTFTITSIDGTQKTVDFTINGVNDAPVIQLPPGAPPTIATVQEDAAAVSGQLTATDPDHGAQLTWSVVDGTTSHHADYTFAIDQLRIVRFNDDLNPLFVDDFDAGDPPPDSPPFNPNGTQNPHTYGGLTGTFTETGGRAIMDSDLSGAGLGVGTPDAFVANSALVRTDIATFNSTPSATPGLKSNVPFVVEGTFDLALPDDRREAYGIRLTDRLTGGNGTPPDQQGDDGLDLVVRMGIDGIVRVQLVEVDFLNDQYNILGGTQFNAAGYEQIKLRLSHSDPMNNSGRITASFDLIDSNGVLPTTTTTLNVVGRIFGTETPGLTADDENWTRAQIVAYAPEESGSSLNGQYGTLTVRQDGSYFYNPGNNLAVVQALAQGETVYDDFQVRVTDEHGATDIETVRIAVQGRNDAPVVSAAVSGGGNEDTSFVVNLLQNASDVDHNAILHVANVVWDEVPGNLPFGFAVAGNSITVDASGGAYQGLALGETFTTHFSYSVVDELGASAIQHATVVITGTNDAATIGGTSTGTVVEAGGNANGTPGTPTASGILTLQDVDNGQAAFQTPASLAGIYGTFSFDASSGAWSYALDNGAANVQALTSTSVVHDTLTVTSLDGTATQVIDVTVQGANDAPTVTGNATGTVTEDQPSALQSRGNLFADDPDGGPAAWSIVGGTTSATTQDFRFQVDNLKVVRNGGTFFEDTFGDGNPPPLAPSFGYSLNGVMTEAAGRAFFDGTQAAAVGSATGVRAALNTDTGSASNGLGLKRNMDFTVEARFDLITPQDGGDAYGVRLTDTNSPTLTINNDSAVDLIVLRDATGVHVALRAINSFTGVVTTLQSIDLTTPLQGQIVLRLSYDEASYADAANGGSVSASFDLVTNGVVVSTTSFTNQGTIFKGEDFTRVQLLGQAGQAETGVYKLAGTYGTLTVAQDGEWHYFLADQQANVQALNTGQQVQDVFTIRVSDGQGGLTDKIVTVNVNGANEPNTPATIGTPNNADVTEDLSVDGNGNLTVSGTIPITDPNPGQAAFQTTVSPFPAALGTLTLAANGSYTYTVANSATQFLAENQIKTNTFTITSVDGTQRQVVFTIHGVNDNPTANADTNATDAVVEAGVNMFSGDAFASGNLILNDSDVDQGDLITVTGAAAGVVSGPITTGTGTPIAGTYGTLTLFGNNGGWSYQLDNADPDTNALADGQIASEAFSYSVSDGHGGSATSTLTIAINGVNDAPSSPQIVLPVLEGSGPYQIDLLANVTDPEGDAFHVENINALHQAFTINPDGSLTFDSDNPFVDLPEGITFTVAAEYDLVDSHGARTHQMAFVEVTGVNDAPTVTATVPGILIEKGQRWDVGITYANSFIDFHDPDSPLELDMTGWADNHNGTWSRAGIYGTATFDGRQLDYNLDSSDPDTIALDTGDVAYETFTVSKHETNGALSVSKDTTFEIHGRSDMYGALIDYDYSFPTDQTVFHHDSAFVGGGIEVSEMSPEYSDGTIQSMINLGWVPIGFVGPDPGHVDFTRDQIIFTFDQDWSYNNGFTDYTFLIDRDTGHVGPPTQEELDNATIDDRVHWVEYAGTPFNGAHISFGSQMPNLTWVEVDPSSTATPSGLRFDHDNLYLDLQGQSFTAGQQIVLDLTFFANGDWLT